MDIVLTILEAVLLCYFGYAALYAFIFSFAGLFYKSPRIKGGVKQNKFAVMIPAYKEDGVIFEVAKEALNQTYAHENYDVVIIADSLQPSTLENLATLPVKTVEVSFVKSTKVKALNEAMRRIGDEYDYGVILDADNVMKPDFLEIVNDLHQQGYDAIQGRRAAKNENNTLSYLDGLSEEINNHVYGRGSSALGVSAALKGSGMSFKYSTLKSMLLKMDSIGGFDRELELRLVGEGTKVKYVSKAVVFDEKVEKANVFENQRKRWISSQFYYLRQYFMSGVAHFFKGHMAYVNSTILRNLALPRLINLGLITVFTFLLFFIQNMLHIPYEIWVLVWSATVLSIAMAIPRSYYSFRLIKSVFRLPLIFWKMFMLLFKLKGANKKFIHTPHSSASQTK